MNHHPHPQNAPASPSPAAAASLTKRIIRAIALTVVAAVLAVGGYSIYVAVHEPDPQETILLGQTRIAAGCPAAFRILVRNRVSLAPVHGAEVSLDLLDNAGKTTRLGRFLTDDSGSVADGVNIPELAPGDYQLVVDAQSSLGRDHLVKLVTIQNPARVLLSSDKPIYQPGQTIHLRGLILNERTQKPFPGEPVTFEVCDPAGNKVYKEAHRTSAFGIASAEVALADELNLGRYEIRALAGSTTGVRTVEVKRYVLPKFKLQVATDKSYYLPGQTVSGTVQAAYFFGKPVANSQVKLTAATLQEQPVAISDLNGHTDAQGTFAFRFTLPDFFAGLPLNAGKALLDLTAEVSEAGGHQETKVLSLSVAQNELELVAIPEAGVLVPGVENILYVVASYPDGRPAVCQITADGVALQTDGQGVCAVHVLPSTADQSCDLAATDAAGHRRTMTFTPEKQAQRPGLLPRTDRAVYPAGATMHLGLLSPDQDNTVFLDVIKDGQTVLTKSVPLRKHKGDYSFSLPSSLVGILKVNAYIITETGEDRGCSRTIYVNPASGLQISAQLSQPVYRPGESARMEFTVTDAAGQPCPAALGIAVVDDSVFALADNRPGLLQQFMDVEADLLKPRYQVRSFASPSSLVAAADLNSAQAYFSSLAGPPSGADLDEFVKNGDLPASILDHIRSLRGTPDYGALRKDPQYAGILRSIDGGGGLYSLRDATRPAKLRAVELRRKAYFKRLGTALEIAFVSALFLLPFVLIIYGARPGAGIFPRASDSESNQKYLRLVSSSYRLLAMLTIFPLIFYPAAGFFCDRWDYAGAGWLILGIEVCVVTVASAVQFARITRAQSAFLPEEWQPQRSYLAAFWVQFICSRLGFALTAAYPDRPDGLFFVVWILGSIFAPICVLHLFSVHLRGRLADRGVESPKPIIAGVGILGTIAVIFILGAMLLPALSAAKRKAQKVSLMNDLKQVDLASRIGEEDGAKPGEAGSSQPRVRRDFPETLCWQPELITDDHGRASLEIPLADSITTWRAAIDGVSAAGRLGSVETAIPVFQDFFADIDLPLALSLGDQVSVPVTCYNYLPAPQDVRLGLASADWFAAPVAKQTLHLGAGEVKSATFLLKALRVGTHALRVTAHGTKLADALEREVHVMPVGEPVELTRNDLLKSALDDTFTLPAEIIPDSQSLVLKFYPSRFSEVVEGMDSIFEAPHGCFEQTSSTTYPNVLALDYLKRLGRLTPETEARARKLVDTGYQRLLTFEVPGGGFEWFGRNPAHVGLTAYGIMEFTDMSHVRYVDEAMLARTKEWLYARQNSDGTWNTSGGLDEWSGESPVTAYVAWALAEAGEHSAGLDHALNYLRTHPEKLSDRYQKALAANAFLARDRADSFGRQLLQELEQQAVKDQDACHWTSRGRGLTYSYGPGLDVETTALCTMALIKGGTSPASVKAALHWLSVQTSKDGCWGSTQATILAIRALIQGSTASLGQDFESSITVSLNGEKVETFRLNQANSDVMKQINLTKHLRAGGNRLELRQSPAGELPLQIVGRYWLPKNPEPVVTGTPPAGLLQIDVHYDRTTLAVNDLLKCAVTVKNKARLAVNMAIVDLGVPPGFDVDTSAFETMQANGQLAKFEITGNQVILYLRGIDARTTLDFSYSLRAKYPLRVTTPASTVYEYYQPQNRAQSKPLELQVLAPI